MSESAEAKLTLDDVLDDDRDLFRIMRARRVARVMRRVGWFTVAAGLVSLGFTFYFMVTGEVGGDEALALITTTILGTLLTGIAAYGSGMGLTLSASNLARRMEQTAGAKKSNPPANEAQPPA